MSLRDLNTGDRFTAEFEVSERTRGTIYTTCGVAFHIGTPIDVTKLPPRARPVRKGDEVRYFDAEDDTRIFLCVLNNTVYMVDGRTPVFVEMQYAKANLRHLDMAEIDWEASE